MKQYALFAGLGILFLIAIILYRNNRQKQKANIFLQQQKEEIDIQKNRAEKTLEELKSTTIPTHPVRKDGIAWRAHRGPLRTKYKTR